MARRQLWKERPGHSWQPTELVSMVFLKLFTGKPLATAQARFFFAAVRNAMREVLEGVLERAQEDRASFLETAYGRDDALRAEVEKLLDGLEVAEREGFLEVPSFVIDAIPLELPDFGEYVVLFHPAYEHGAEPVVFPTTLAGRFREAPLDDDYRDPLGDREPLYASRWLAGSAPVPDTSYFVVVQVRE
jgi:hypothetical protein